MESASQKLALSKSIQAEEKVVIAKRTASIAKKAPTEKAKQSKSGVAVKVLKKPQPAIKAVKEVNRAKIVRDSFTMPQDEYKLLSELKKKCLSQGIDVKKSELLRAGLKSLAKLNLATLKKQLSALPQIKTGRPSKLR
jgi:hypothetical protein